MIRFWSSRSRRIRAVLRYPFTNRVYHKRHACQGSWQQAAWRPRELGASAEENMRFHLQKQLRGCWSKRRKHRVFHLYGPYNRNNASMELIIAEHLLLSGYKQLTIRAKKILYIYIYHFQHFVFFPRISLFPNRGKYKMLTKNVSIIIISIGF